MKWEIAEAFNALTDRLEVLEKILNQCQAWLNPKTPDKVWFFAAGYRKETCTDVNRLLEKRFQGSILHVGNDLEALGIALGQACLVGILGTGASAAWWDGNHIVKKGPSLGWILGDEGSGAWLGKQLLRALYYDVLPSELKPDLENYLSQSGLEDVLRRVHAPEGRRFVASLAQWLSSDNVRRHAWTQALLQQGFGEYWQFQVQPLLNDSNTTVALFSGGVVWRFRKEWERFVKERELPCQLAPSARDYLMGHPHRLNAILGNEPS